MKNFFKTLTPYNVSINITLTELELIKKTLNSQKSQFLETEKPENAKKVLKTSRKQHFNEKMKKIRKKVL